MRRASIKFLRRADAAIIENVAADVFDDPVDNEAACEFLDDPNHLLIVAMDDAKDGQVVGFVSGVKIFHPDKPAPELWVNEVGVAPAYQKQGIGKKMMARLFEEAKKEGCSEAWVLTDKGNNAALALYKSAGGAAPTEHVMVEFDLLNPEIHLDDGGAKR